MVRLNFLILFAGVSSVLAKGKVDHGKALSEWLSQHKDGYFHPNLQIRREKGDDRYAIFATSPVKKGEKLFTLPDSYVYFNRDVDESTDCETAKKLKIDLSEGENYSGTFAPYIRYLLDEPRGMIPSDFSSEGKRLIEQIVGMELPPADVTSVDFATDCEAPELAEDDMIQRAYMNVVQRSWVDVLLPVYELMRPGEGNLWNANSPTVHEPGDIDVQAIRDIETGEMIRISFDSCEDCEVNKAEFGTPQKFRNHGIVEDMPQRWTFPMVEVESDVSFELDNVNGTTQITWLATGHSIEYCLRVLVGQAERLREMDPRTESSVPAAELRLITRFYDSMLNALDIAIREALSVNDDNIEDIQEECAVQSDGSQQCFAAERRYDALDGQSLRKHDFETYPCYIGRAIPFPGYDTIEVQNSQYQEMEFFQDAQNKDTCFYLDRTVQICGSYRPHYHEIVVHYPASYIPTVKRVVFVGGGDSMLLHEVLKYESLELVVGLEIDQLVTRSSFKHFGTQPHWDDDRVQWWYGDAAKSLLMLPKEYSGSFDLVLVDLSETVTSMLVTEGLDIFAALGLLLKPDGILVKNELYFNEMSSIFDYSTQVAIWDVPVICYQLLSLGSPDLDFMSRPRVNHNVNTVVYNQRQESGDRYGYIHSFRHNPTPSIRQHCEGPDKPADASEVQDSSPGILMVLEVEGGFTSTESLRLAIKEAVISQGLTIISDISDENEEPGDTAVFVLQEGYVTSRVWVSHQYCALDVLLWSSFNKHEALKRSIVASVGATSWSSYRIVTGGMFGLPTWKEERKNRGPQSMKCDPASSQRVHGSTTELEENVLDAAVSIIPRKDPGLVIIICSTDTSNCSNDVYNRRAGPHHAFILPTCVETGNNSSNAMIACEREVWSTLSELVNQHGKIAGILLSPEADISMTQITAKILGSYSNRQRILSDEFAVIATNIDEDPWKKHFLNGIHRDILWKDPGFVGHVGFSSTTNSVDLGIALSEDPDFIQKFNTLATEISEATGLPSEIKNIENGVWDYMTDFTPSQFALPSDYDQSSPLDQWKSQQPLGRQVVSQFDWGLHANVDRVKVDHEGRGQYFPGKVVNKNEDGTYNIQFDDGDKEERVPTGRIQFEPKPAPMVVTKDSFAKTTTNSLQSAVSGTQIKSHVESDIGDGCIAIGIWPTGVCIFLWDGRSHLDVNLFTVGDGADQLSRDIKAALTKSMPQLMLSLRDDQPRGFGRVVSFESDIKSSADPHWASTG